MSLIAVFAGQAAPTADPNVLSLTEVATITGGTGRFADATGTFTLERLLDLTTGHFLRLVYRDHIPSRETLTD